jgi:uncharacterized membrane protein YjdF
MFLFCFMIGLLSIVTTFGVGTAINMVFKRWWLSTAVYAVFSLYLFIHVIHVGSRLSVPEWTAYILGALGVLLASWGCRALKERGYALFS